MDRAPAPTIPGTDFAQVELRTLAHYAATQAAVRAKMFRRMRRAMRQTGPLNPIWKMKRSVRRDRANFAELAKQLEGTR